VRRRVWRWSFPLVAWSLGTGFLAMATVLVRLTYVVPPSDGAHGIGLWVLTDPFVLWVALPIAGVASVTGMFAAAWLLEPTDHRKSQPLVAAAVFVASWFFADLHYWSAFPVFLVALFAMLACRLESLDRVRSAANPDRERPDAHAGRLDGGG